MSIKSFIKNYFYSFKIRKQLLIIKSSFFYDELFYLKDIPVDHILSGIDPSLHYYMTGWREGRDPGPHFSTNGYLFFNPDVAEIGMNPLEHFELYGEKEGRTVVSPIQFEKIQFSDNFYSSYYEEKSSDITSLAIGKPLQFCSRIKQFYNLGIEGRKILINEGFYSLLIKIVNRLNTGKNLINIVNNNGQIFTPSKKLFLRFIENKNPDPIVSAYIRGMGIYVSKERNVSITIPNNVHFFVIYSDDSTKNICYKGYCESNTQDFCIFDRILDRTEDCVIKNCLDLLKTGGILLVYDNLKLLENIKFQFSSIISDGSIKILKEGFLSNVYRPYLNDEIDDYNHNLDSSRTAFIIFEKFNFIDEIEAILNDKDNFDNVYEYSLDVIIPVYNAYNDLLHCLYSALMYQEKYRIILINDCSSDKDIIDLFSRLKLVDSHKIILLENEENLGFVKTVNKGMHYSDNNVLLLNSDTIVTKGWAEKLLRCANSCHIIGTVTPFTNNGTICSIPCFCEENEIPNGYTIDTFARYIEKISIRQYPTIPTAVGFCMLIKREVINKVGYFDEESFGMGYGEENDFCMRAKEQGYIHVLCDDTFVFHKGEASFSEKKKELIEKNTATLAEMYPEYLPTVHSFINNNPLKNLHSNIIERISIWDQSGDKRRILYILHSWGGGTEKHVKDLINSLNDFYVFYVLQVEIGCLVLTEINNQHEIQHKYPLKSLILEYCLHNEEYENILLQIIDYFEIDLIHIHHLIGHPIDINRVSKLRKIPLIFTVHDFYAVCPNINLLDCDNKFCNSKSIPTKCDECLSISKKLNNGFINEWRSEFTNLFKNCYKIIAPSESAAIILLQFYPTFHNKCVVIEHGTDYFMSKSINEMNSGIEEMIVTTFCHNFNEGLFHIAFIGGLSVNKGREILYSLAKSPELEKKVRWSVFGVTDLHNQIGYHSSLNLTIHGHFQDFNELRQLIEIESVNLIIFPAIWPETFSYTLSEAWALGIPVLVSNLGALKERVEQIGGGWVVKNADLDGFKGKILEILDSPDDYRKKKLEIYNISPRLIDEMAKDYKDLYSQIFDKHRSYAVQNTR